MAPEPLDTRVTNGRFVVPDGPAITQLTIHDGRVTDDDESEVWRTISASGFLVFPGMLQPGAPLADSALELVRGGTTTCIGAFAGLPDASMDLLPTNDYPLRTISPLPDGELSDEDWKALLGDEAIHFSGVEQQNFPVIQFLYHEGHVQRGMTLERIAALTSGNLARAAGIYPRKGSFDTGSDGDLFVFDPDTPDPYRDLPWPGRVILSLMRGKLLLYNGQIHTSAGDGIAVE